MPLLFIKIIIFSFTYFMNIRKINKRKSKYILQIETASGIVRL